MAGAGLAAFLTGLPQAAAELRVELVLEPAGRARREQWRGALPPETRRVAAFFEIASLARDRQPETIVAGFITNHDPLIFVGDLAPSAQQGTDATTGDRNSFLIYQLLAIVI